MIATLRFSVMLGCLISIMGTTALAGGGKGGGKNNVDVANGNAFDDENGDVQVWLLSEDDDVPTTKAEADAAGGVVLGAGPFSQIRFTGMDDGNYLLVAANKNAYEALDDDAPITPGVEVSAEAIELAGGETLAFTVTNDPNGGPPIISEGIEGPGGPGGPGGGSGPGSGF